MTVTLLQVAQKLPDTPYMTFLDTYLFMSLCIISSAMLVIGVSQLLISNGFSDPDAVENGCILLLIVNWLIFNLAYFMIALRQAQKVGSSRWTTEAEGPGGEGTWEGVPATRCKAKKCKNQWVSTGQIYFCPLCDQAQCEEKQLDDEQLCAATPEEQGELNCSKNEQKGPRSPSRHGQSQHESNKDACPELWILLGSCSAMLLSVGAWNVLNTVFWVGAVLYSLQCMFVFLLLLRIKVLFVFKERIKDCFPRLRHRMAAIVVVVVLVLLMASLYLVLTLLALALSPGAVAGLASGVAVALALLSGECSFWHNKYTEVHQAKSPATASDHDQDHDHDQCQDLDQNHDQLNSRLLRRGYSSNFQTEVRQKLAGSLAAVRIAPVHWRHMYQRLYDVMIEGTRLLASDTDDKSIVMIEENRLLASDTDDKSIESDSLSVAEVKNQLVLGNVDQF